MNLAESTSLMDSVNLTLIGMSVVFLFLILLVFVMKALGWLVKVLEKYFPQPVPAAAATAVRADNAAIAIAIAAAKRLTGK